jgi:hypothetical protein
VGNIRGVQCGSAAVYLLNERLGSLQQVSRPRLLRHRFMSKAEAYCARGEKEVTMREAGESPCSAHPEILLLLSRSGDSRSRNCDFYSPGDILYLECVVPKILMVLQQL